MLGDFFSQIDPAAFEGVDCARTGSLTKGFPVFASDSLDIFLNLDD